MNSISKIAAVLVCVPALFLQTACSSTQIESLVNVGVAAGTTLVDQLAADKTIPSNDAVAASNYAAVALPALDNILAEVASSDASAVKSAKISSIGLSAVTSFNGLPSTAQAIAGSLNASIVAVLTSVGVAVPAQSPTALKVMYAMGFADAPTATPAKTMPKLSIIQKWQVNKLRAKIHKAQAKLAQHAPVKPAASK